MSWSASLPWIIAACGWFCTHLFSEARERRKEVRIQIDKLHAHLSKIEQAARAFHCASEFDDSKAGDLTSDLYLLERLMNRVPIFSMDNFTQPIIRLRRAITLTNFDRTAFVQQNLNSNVLQDISSAAQDVEDEMEWQYRRHYPSKFPYFKLPYSN